MVLFAVTGITLNHGSQIEAKPRVTRQQAKLPLVLLPDLTAEAVRRDGHPGPLAGEVAQWLASQFHLDLGEGQAEWSRDEVYVPLPRPGGDAWVRISLPEGEVEYELTDRGWIAWLNDVHKGRHTGSVWLAFMDVFALACIVFSVTGLLILKAHAGNRPGTWPVVGLGVLLPLLVMILFIH